MSKSSNTLIEALQNYVESLKIDTESNKLSELINHCINTVI